MAGDQRAQLQAIRTFPQLVRYLRDELGWPVDSDAFDDMVFEYTPEELGIASAHAAAIQEIKRLRPLVPNQPWGIFFVKFEPKRLPVVALRRILSQVVIKKRATARAAELAAWQLSDLLFISNYGDRADERRISLAYFSQSDTSGDLPMLKVLGWDGADTNLHLDSVAAELHSKLHWPADTADVAGWRSTWAAAFTVQHGEIISTAKRLAVRLAELARGIRAKALAALAIESEAGPLRSLLRSFRDALLHDLDDEGFADMYAQTIAYGLLTARISRPQGLIADNLADMVPVTNPFLKEMLETFVRMGGRRKAGRGSTGIDFDELGVNDVVQLLRAANMEAVVRDFGDKNPQEDPVIHFYELFLKEYDAKKRMQRGVFYTPRPVVSYIVRSVDELLRTEFGLEDGLADTTTWGEMVRRHKDLKIPEGTLHDHAFVQILDPATGTGTFLVEVIDIIHKTMVAKWKAQGHGEKKIAALWNEYVPKQMLNRLHAYELLMAPYAIAHLKVGLKLYETGYRFGSDERARIYLTNALEPASDKQLTLDFLPALAHEAQAVNEIKRHNLFTVVIGNPPYAKLSSNREGAAEALVGPFKVEVRGERNIQPLSDDYLKFFGLAVSLSARVPRFAFGMITNRGYLNGLIHRGVRHVISTNWQRLWLVDLHGDSNIGERSPDGSANDNVFDIQQGVAITVGLKNMAVPAGVKRCDTWGTRYEKQCRLAALTPSGAGWTACEPEEPHFFFAEPTHSSAEMEQSLPLCEVMPTTNTGIKTHRDDLVVDFDADVLSDRIRRFVDAKRTDTDVRTEFFGVEKGGRYKAGDNRDWSMSEARKGLQQSKIPLGKFIRELDYRPFDRRFVFYSAAAVDFAREDLMQHMEDGQNIGLVATRQVPNGDFCHVLVTRRLIEMKTCSHDRGTNLFPLWLKHEQTSLDMGAPLRPNISTAFLRVLSGVLEAGCADLNGLPAGLSPEDILGFIYAAFHSPDYRSRYADSLRIDFPRIPVPGSPGLFHDLARLGSELVALHLLESPKLDYFTTTYTGPKDPAVGRVGWSDDTVWLDAAATKKGQPATPGTIGFRGVPEAVWNFHIGGYQVCEKWLKDRKGRTLSKDDIAHYQKIVVALNETIRLMGEIDAVIEHHGGWPDAFAQPAGAAPAGAAGSAPVAVFGGARQLNLGAAAPAALQPPADSAEETPAVGARALAGAALMCAVRQLFAKGIALERTAAVGALAQQLGVSAADAAIAAELGSALRTAVRRGILASVRGQLQVDVRTIAAYPRDFLKDQFLAALPGRQWVERDAAMRGFARWLGFKRTGKAIDDSARSLINGLLRDGRLGSAGSQIRREL